MSIGRVPAVQNREIEYGVQGSVDWQARKRATDDSALCACGASSDSWYNSTNMVQKCNELAGDLLARC